MPTDMELKMLQALDLDTKIKKTKMRIIDWVDHFGESGVYISFSGGKDSTVLLHLVRELYPSIPAVFIDTGLEYPEIRQFVDTFENVVKLRPNMTFNKVIEKYGYPVISKEQSHYIYLVHNTKSEVLRNKHLHGINRDGSKCQFTISKKWKYLIDAPFKISDQCCEVMKKRPVKKYEKENGRVPFIGTMAQESVLRTKKYLANGCNAFETKRPISTPMGFWTEQDVLQYIKKYNIPYASVYGDIVENNEGKLYLTGETRTGCMFCMYGVHLEQGENRFQRMQKTHPKQYNYCLNNLGLKEVLDYINVSYENDIDIKKDSIGSSYGQYKIDI